jgi:hypothetical protein
MENQWRFFAISRKLKTTNPACQSIQKGEEVPWHTIYSGWVWEQGKAGMVSAGEAG